MKEHFRPADFMDAPKTVAAYFLPFIEEVSFSNIEGRNASSLWAETYVETNKLIFAINGFIKNELEKEGFHTAFAPPTANFDPKILKSNWSHRHIAEITGLGSFGINNILITEKGCCGRLGTFVTDLPVEKETTPLKEYCIAKKNGNCGACQKKCVKDAFSEEGFDRFSCFEMCVENGELYKSLGEAWVCGKCLVGLPCSVK